MIGYSIPTRNLAAIPFSSSPAGLWRGSSLQMRWASLSLRANGLPRLKLFLQMRFQSRCSAIDTPRQVPDELSEIIFMGTGTSEGIPRVSCLTDPLKTCPVCSKAMEPNNKNRRLNTSILIRYSNSSGNRNILIDVGKFFYHSALRWFPQFGLRNIDAVIITHSHADAIGGLDDLRDWTNNVQASIPIYVAKRDFEVTPLPVWHGKGYRSLGFRFGNICYISDVSEIPEETYLLLKDCEILIMDALRPDRSSATHFGLPRALDEVRRIRPRRTFFTGMMHLMDHDKVNEDLAKLMETEGLDVQLSYDGLRVPVKL
ncbi:putative hydrolase [Nymphaea thermarum]|nr:putative hydrolase [Nymphaea thermarum]